VLVLGAVMVGIGLGLATGGHLGNFAHLRFRWPLLVLIALVVREATVVTPLSRLDGIQYLYVAAVVALIGWTVWHFHRVPGVWLVALGAACNLVVIVANGSRMPVAAELAPSLVQRGHVGQYTVMGPATNLAWLGDWITFGPVPGVYSPGDMIGIVGIAAVCCLATRARPGTLETPGRIVSDPP
jgi:hypothetical protein